MFTGIVEAVGRIVSIAPVGAREATHGQNDVGTQAGTGTEAGAGTGADAGDMRLTIDAGALGLDDVALGDSIAIQGACMTVVACEGTHFEVDISRESLRRTAGLDRVGAAVNLEKAMRAHDRLGGHLVTGHVDGTGTVTHFAAVAGPAASYASHELRVLTAPAIGRYLAYKGSITINGVSLTVNTVSDLPEGCEFSINVIPHTLEVTSLGELIPGATVNLEVDLIARYVERMLATDR